MSDCGRYLIITTHEGCDPVNRLFYTDLQSLPNGISGILPYIKVVDNFEAEYEVKICVYPPFFLPTPQKVQRHMTLYPLARPLYSGTISNQN